MKKINGKEMNAILNLQSKSCFECQFYQILRNPILEAHIKFFFRSLAPVKKKEMECKNKHLSFKAEQTKMLFPWLLTLRPSN